MWHVTSSNISSVFFFFFFSDIRHLTYSHTSSDCSNYQHFTMFSVSNEVTLTSDLQKRYTLHNCFISGAHFVEAAHCLQAPSWGTFGDTYTQCLHYFHLFKHYTTFLAFFCCERIKCILQCESVNILTAERNDRWSVFSPFFLVFVCRRASTIVDKWKGLREFGYIHLYNLFIINILYLYVRNLVRQHLKQLDILFPLFRFTSCIIIIIWILYTVIL